MTTAAQNSKQVLAQKGTAATPSFSFLGGNTSGMYLAGTNQLGFGTAGVNAVTIDSSGNVGIGTSSPGYKLDIYSATSSTFTLQGDSTVSGLSYRASADTSAPTLTLRKARGSVASPAAVSSGDTSGSLVYSVYGGTNTRNVAAIRASVETYTSDTDISGYLWFQTASAGGTTLTERMRIDASGNVGIGTSSPAQKLHVTGNAIFGGSPATQWSTVVVSGDVAIQSSGPILNFVNAAGSSRFGYLYHTGTAGSLFLLNQEAGALRFGTSNAEQMRIDSSGNVGIGTSSPDVNLSVFGSTAVAADVGGEISIGGFYNGSSKTSYGSIAGVNQNGTGNTSGQLLFKTRTNFGSLTERMRIDSSGNVGIGTSSPANKLDVVGPGGGAIQATISDGANQGFIRISKSAALYGIGAGSDYGGVLFYSNNATERMRIDTNGNVGIGTSSPGNKLQVQATGTTQVRVGEVTGTYYFDFGRDTTDGLFQFIGNQGLGYKWINVSTEAMRINSSGNVGIGTSSPAAKLQIEQNQAAYTYCDLVNTTNGGGAIFRQIVRNIANTSTTSVDYAKLIGSGLAINNNDTNAANFTAFGVGASERMRIDSSGNVGIGTSSPAYPLDIQANGSAFGWNIRGRSADGIAVGRFANNANTETARIRVDSDGTFYINNTSSNTTRMTIDASGNVGIGTSSPNASAILDAQSTTKGVRFPNMTTTQKNAISSPAAGLVVFDTTLAKLCVYSGSAWQTITST